MTDIVERLHLAANDETQSSGVLFQEAANEIERLRGEYRRIMAKLDENQKFGEPEF